MRVLHTMEGAFAGVRAAIARHPIAAGAVALVELVLVAVIDVRAIAAVAAFAYVLCMVQVARP